VFSTFACRIMCEAQRFSLRQTDVPIHNSLQQWLNSNKLGWVCISDTQDFEAVLPDEECAADARIKR
jgi:hypothetical protein